MSTRENIGLPRVKASSVAGKKPSGATTGRCSQAIGGSRNRFWRAVYPYALRLGPSSEGLHGPAAGLAARLPGSPWINRGLGDPFIGAEWRYPGRLPLVTQHSRVFSFLAEEEVSRKILRGPESTGCWENVRRRGDRRGASHLNSGTFRVFFLGQRKKK